MSLDIRESFEKELRDRLTQKSSTNVSEETILLKAFKYYDLNNSGYLEIEEFKKALEKVGLVYQNPSVIKQLFNFYDTDQSGGLNQKEFSSIVMRNTGVVSRKLNAGKQQNKAGPVGDIAKLHEQFRTRLAARGARGIIGIQRQFRIADDDGNGTLSRDEFLKCCNDFGVGLSKQQVNELFRHLDINHDGVIQQTEFLDGVRPPMNSLRKSLVNQAFDKLDKNGNGILELDDIMNIYDASKHPEVRSGRKTKESVLQEFLETFKMKYNLKNRTRNDGRITRDEFLSYYKDVSSSIDNDNQFATMITKAQKLDANDEQEGKKPWMSKQHTMTSTHGQGQEFAKVGDAKMPPKSQLKQGMYEKPQTSDNRNIVNQTTQYLNKNKVVEKRTNSPERLQNSNTQTVNESIKLFKDKIKSRGARGILGLQRLFKIIDDDNSFNISFEEFSKVVKDFRIAIDMVNLKKVFNAFDRDGNGVLDYDELLQVIRGQMNEKRVELVKRAQAKLDKDHSGIVDINDIKGVQDASRHPDVKSGKKTEDEVLMEFLETFEHHAVMIKQGIADHKITFDEFKEYQNNVSMSIDDDRYFELMMTNAWNFDNITYKKAYGNEQ